MQFEGDAQMHLSISICNRLFYKQTSQNMRIMRSMKSSWQAVSPIHYNIGSGGIASCIGSQVKIRPLELLSLTFATHGDLILPDILGVLINETGDLSSNVTGGNGVGTSKPDPFHSERFACSLASHALHIIPEDTTYKDE